jgi:hypothetical protein
VQFCLFILETQMEMNSAPLGEVIDSLYTARAARLELEQQVKDMKKVETEMKQQIIARLDELQLASGRGAAATATITHSTTANVTDWPALYQYIKDNNMFELLHRRLTTTLWSALEADGQHVPGTEPFVVVDLSLTKAAQS